MEEVKWYHELKYLEVHTGGTLYALETSDSDVLLIAQPESDDVQHHLGSLGMRGNNPNPCL